MLKLVTAALAVLALAPAAAGAVPAVDGVFDLNGSPRHLTLGPDGNVWVALDGLTYDVARVEPNGTVTGFTTAAITFPVGIATSADGRLWVTQPNGVAHFLPGDPASARAVPIAAISDARGIVAGPDGALWTASGDNAIRIATDETFTAFRVTDMGARGIAAGNGKLYIADFGSRRIVELATDGTPTFHTLPEAPQEVVAGPSGQLAAAMPNSLIGRLTPPDPTVLTSDVPATDPFGIVFADDLAYWTANFNTHTLARLTPAGALTTLSGLPAGTGPRFLTKGAGGTLWVGLETSRQIARVTGVVVPAPPPEGPPPPGGGRDVTRPRVTRARLPRAVRRGKSATLRVTLSEAAALTVRFERKLPGRRKAGRCVRPRRAPQGRRCTRFVAAGVQRRAARAGVNELRIAGRIGRRVLPVGAYRLTIVARDAAGNRSRAIKKPLRVTPPPRRRR